MKKMLYPFKFEPLYKQIVWGGRRIEQYFKRSIPDGNIAESWEICCRDDGMSIVKNGNLRGIDLYSLITEYKEKILGTKVVEKYGLYFPILIKIIDANDKLSVQVHPNDSYACTIGERNGKNELWYIIDAAEDTKLVYGLKSDITKESFLTAVTDGKVREVLNTVPVKPGDCLYIPAGTVHAILDGILIAEIQQNSNTTYRIFDWDRCDSNGNRRELHIDRALDVINFDFKTCGISRPIVPDSLPIPRRDILKSEHFNIYEISVAGELKSSTEFNSFTALMNIQGQGKIHYDAGSQCIEQGETMLLPAFLGEYRIEGNMKLLVTYID